jgi:hypothetical protein
MWPSRSSARVITLIARIAAFSRVTVAAGHALILRALRGADCTTLTNDVSQMIVSATSAGCRLIQCA